MEQPTLSKYWDRKFKENEKLIKEWYAKLKADGFNDIEKIFNGEYCIKQVSSHPLRRAKNATKREARRKYYQTLSEHVQTEPWTNSIDEIVMTMYSEGKYMRDISEELKSLGYKHHVQTVRYIVRGYETKWNIKKWQPNQLTSYRKVQPTQS
jgi:uncharacterized protein (UPF0297 family)